MSFKGVFDWSMKCVTNQVDFDSEMFIIFSHCAVQQTRKGKLFAAQFRWVSQFSYTCLPVCFCHSASVCIYPDIKMCLYRDKLHVYMMKCLDAIFIYLSSYYITILWCITLHSTCISKPPVATGSLPYLATLSFYFSTIYAFLCPSLWHNRQTFVCCYLPVY